MAFIGISATAPLRPQRLLKEAIKTLDVPLRLAHGVREYTSSDECILRIAVERAEAPIRYPDGVVIERGDRVIDLHFWNEHLPRMPSDGPNFAWANRFRRRLNHSLSELAVHVQRDSRLAGIKGVRALLASATPGHRDTVRRFGAHFGLEMLADSTAVGCRRRSPGPADTLWARLLLWTYNPPALKGRDIGKPREEIGMSTAALIARFGAAEARAGLGEPITTFRPPTQRAAKQRAFPVPARRVETRDQPMAL